jgi:tetratricopeptide (TPR) repeat protein
MSRHVDKALHLMRRRPDLAAKELLKVLAETPDDAYAHSLLGECLLNCGDIEGAYAQAAETVRLEPESPRGFGLLALCHYESSRFMEAEVAVEEAIKYEPHTAYYWALLANAQDAQGHLKDALQSTERALEIDANDVHSHNLRAYILSKMKASDGEVEKSMRTAIEGKPDDASTHAYRGWTLLETLQHNESIQHFRESLRLDPGSDWARSGLMTALKMRQWPYQVYIRMTTPWHYVLLLLLFCVTIGALTEAPKLVPTQLKAVADGLCVIGMLCSLLIAVVLAFPKSIVSEIVLSAGLLFDADASLILRPEERRFTIHLTTFLLAALITFPAYMLWGQWLIPVVLVALYIATLPLTDVPEKRTRKQWLGHVGVSALVICSFVWFAHSHPPNQVESNGLSKVQTTSRNPQSAGDSAAPWGIFGAIVFARFVMFLLQKSIFPEVVDKKEQIRNQMLTTRGTEFSVRRKFEVPEELPAKPDFVVDNIPVKYALCLIWPFFNLAATPIAAVFREPLHTILNVIYYGSWIAFAIWFVVNIFPVPLVLLFQRAKKERRKGKD